MVQILSGFRESIFHDSWTLITMFSKPRTPKCRNFDGAWICCHLSSEMDGPDSLRKYSFPSLHLSSPCVKKMPMASRSSPPVTPDPTVGVISWFRVSRYGVQSPLLVQLSILDFAIVSDRRRMIFLDPTVQIESWFCDSWILMAVFSDLYSLRVSEMPGSHHVSSLMDGPNDFRILWLRKSAFLPYAPEE